MQTETIQLNDKTISKSVTISDDPKRPGLLIGRYHDENGRNIGTLYGKKNQPELAFILKNGHRAPFI